MFWTSPTYSNSTEQPTEDTYFTVGVTNGGNTVLKIHHDNCTTTMTMPPDKTQQLIKLLATTLDTGN